jgi:TRAP-type C4-dicarboxylate transport system substrate-binding protein
VLLLVCPRTWLQGLTPPQRAALQRAVARATRLQREQAAAEDAQALEQLQRLGVKVLQPEEIDRVALRAATAALAAQQRSVLPAPLLEAYLGQAALH